MLLEMFNAFFVILLAILIYKSVEINEVGTEGGGIFSYKILIKRSWTIQQLKMPSNVFATVTLSFHLVTLMCDMS